MSMLIIQLSGLNASCLELLLEVFLDIHGSFSVLSKASLSENFYKQQVIDLGQAVTIGNKHDLHLQSIDYRWMKSTITPYMLIGGSATLSYQLIFDYLRHHEEGNNDRPLYFDHMYALTLIGAVSMGMYGGMPRFWFTGAFIGGMLVAPMSWWLIKQGRINAQARPSNIFYENSVNREELERIHNLDAIESLGSALAAQPGYGYFQGDARHV